MITEIKETKKKKEAKTNQANISRFIVF